MVTLDQWKFLLTSGLRDWVMGLTKVGWSEPSSSCSSSALEMAYAWSGFTSFCFCDFTVPSVTWELFVY
jgi:hypothetical protein